MSQGTFNLNRPAGADPDPEHGSLPPQEPAARSPWIDWLFGAALLLTLTCVAYVPAMRAGYIWDDDNYVTKNPTLRTRAGLWSIWTDPRATPQYYPLVHSMFWLEYQTWGLNPAGYHLVNILLQGANAILLWSLLRHLGLPAAWFAAALFAVHPVHVESVAWITERKNVLSGLFYLSAALAYCRFALPRAPIPRQARWGWYALSLVCFAAALLSKTVTVTLPAALLVIVWWRRSRIGIRDVIPVVPMLLVGIPFGLLTVWLERNHVGAAGADWGFSPIDRCLIAGRALWFYAAKLAWPAPLVFIYPRWNIDSNAWWQYLFPLAAVGLAAFLARRRRPTGPLAAVLLFAGTLFPALGFFDVFPMRYSFVADHFQYLASIALLVLAAAAGYRVALWLTAGKKYLAIGAGGLVLLILAGLTWRQARSYRDRETLWRETLARNPACSMAHHNLGVVLREQGRLMEASHEFRRVLQLDPRDHLARINLANLWCDLGRYNEAVELFETILAEEPDNVLARYNLANALDALQRVSEAETEYRQVLERDPRHPLARLNLAALLMQQHRWTAAEAELQELLRHAPDYHLAHCNLAAVYHHQGKRELALSHAREALRLVPDSPEAREILRRISADVPEPTGGPTQP